VLWHPQRHSPRLALQVEVPTALPTLQQTLPMASVAASVPGLAEGEESYKLDLQKVPMAFVARILHLETTVT
jgi:hypothetical protein